eukprot:3926250-Pyramimonas_sp.AAC.1
MGSSLRICIDVVSAAQISTALRPKGFEAAPAWAIRHWPGTSSGLLHAVAPKGSKQQVDGSWAPVHRGPVPRDWYGRQDRGQLRRLLHIRRPLRAVQGRSSR